MSTSHIGRENVGRIAERIVANELESHGFQVRNLNLEGLAANVDLLAVKDESMWLIQVKGSTYNEQYPNNGWWFQYGYCHEGHIQNADAKLFNQRKGPFQANLVALVCVRAPHEYQIILLPIKLAEKVAQINLNYAYRTKKSDGSDKKPNKVWFTLFPTKSRTAFVNDQLKLEQDLVKPFLIDRSRKIERSDDAMRRRLEEEQMRSSDVLSNLKTAEQKLEEMETAEFERELAEANIANFPRNLELLKEFEHVDREGWESLP